MSSPSGQSNPCADPGKGKRCPKGCRRSKKDGKCYPIKGVKKPRGSMESSRFKVIEGETQGTGASKEMRPYPFLYPTLDDPRFAADISRRKEFYDSRYTGGVKDVVSEADRLCNSEFELAPHQLFVRNFLSMQTPYNGMLLYHGLGSGKTCSAIGVAEEMRDYLRQTGAGQGQDKIIIVAAPNVQENFKMQLFDPAKLVENPPRSGLWNIRSCTGAKYLREVNPLATAKLSRDKITKEVRRLIRASYRFYGYEKFANIITKMLEGVQEDTPVARRKMRALQKWSSNRLIIIDEVHNLSTFDSKDKVVADVMNRLVQAAPGLRLLLLSATPMYHDPKEILWLLNLLRVNDGRSFIKTSDVFQPDSTLRLDETGDILTGKRLLQARATGYISFVRGENPYTFPYRIWPSMFAPDKTFDREPLPTIQLNGDEIQHPLQHLKLFLVRAAGFQARAYQYIVNAIDTSSLQYTVLQTPIQALNITYPLDGGKEDLETEDPSPSPADLVAARGLARTMNYEVSGNTSARDMIAGTFEYAPNMPRVFSATSIQNYSAKISAIVESAITAEGVILIHTEYIAGGVVPLALALEERGLRRAGKTKSLFKTPPTEAVDYRPGGPPDGSNTIQAAYTLITGDSSLSPDNVAEIRLATANSNSDGRDVKVVIISQAGAEGLDLKFIRQVHVMEPWYNMSRIEQIIGRAIRTCSHRALPFHMRNVQIFLYATLLSEPRQESADVYVYRQAERRAIRIGMVSRALKESAVDCLLNLEQTGFTVEDMQQTVEQVLADGLKIEYAVGDRPYTSACDYMSKCKYKCVPVETLSDALGEEGPVLDTFSESALVLNGEKVMQRIREIFSDQYFINKKDLIQSITVQKQYPIEQIDAALGVLVNDQTERLTDKYGRSGRLVNVGNMYYFQPLELEDIPLTVYERQSPLAFKRDAVILGVSKPNDMQMDSIPTAPRKGRLQMVMDELSGVFSVLTDQKPPKKLSMLQKGAKQLASQGVSVSDVERLVIGFVIDRIDESGIQEILNSMSSSVQSEDQKREADLVKEYLESQMIRQKGMDAIMTYTLDGSVDAQRLLVRRTGNEWGAAQPEDLEELKPALREVIASYSPATEVLGSPIGFLYPFKGGAPVFKIKDMYLAGKTGARCDQGGATDVKQQVVAVLEENGFAMDKKMNRATGCVFQELALRYMTDQKVSDRVWYITPPRAVAIRLPKLNF